VVVVVVIVTAVIFRLNGYKPYQLTGTETGTRLQRTEIEITENSVK